MGHKLKRIDLKVKEGEQIDLNIKMTKEKRSLIHGVVVDESKKPIEDASVLLFKNMPCDPCDLKPITHTFTDDCGQFVFGPLDPDEEYTIKVWVNGVCIVDFYH